MTKAEKIASVCHEVNRGFCLSIGDLSQPAWEEAPEWQKQSAIAGVEKALNDPEITPEELHKSWLEVKVADGWVYGSVKDAEKKTHPCMVPYSELPLAQRTKDYLFKAVVSSMAGIV